MHNLKEFNDIIKNQICKSNKVFVTFHKNADIDAIASALGISHFIKLQGKIPYILISDEYNALEYGVKKIVDNENVNYDIIGIEKYNKLKTKNDLLIVVDANKQKQVCCKDFLNNFKDIILIDHHKEDQDTIDTEYKFINNVSSASEIIIELLLLNKIKVPENLSNYLLAGIYLDTNKYSVNCSYRTMELVSKLLKKGACFNKVNELFEEDFLNDRKIQDLVSKASFITENIALCIADKNVKYTKAELAKVADYLLKYKIDAVFAAGFINDEIISISARSKGNIDVSEIMKEFGGGGHQFSAASELTGSDFDDISKKLNKILKNSDT